MKKKIRFVAVVLFLLWFSCLFPWQAMAADEGVLAFPEITSAPGGTVMLYAIIDPSGTPLDRKISVENLMKYITDDVIIAALMAGSGALDLSGFTLTLPPITGQITEPDLDATNTPSEGMIPSYNSAGTNFTWVWMPVEIGVAVSDETTDLTIGTAKVTIRAPFAFTLTAVRANVNTAPVGAAIQVDINENGASVLSTKLTIDASELTSATAATAAVISDSAIADDGEITFDIDQVGSTTTGKGLKIWLIGTRPL